VNLLSIIIDGMAKEFDKHFTDCKIYSERVPQSLSRPCFFIKSLTHSNVRQNPSIVSRSNSYCIHYYPEDINNSVTECLDVMQTLYSIMEHIQLDGVPAKGVNMRGEIHDEILQFYVDYNVNLREVREYETMDTLESLKIKTR